MASITYQVEVDTLRDGTYGGAIDDISGYVESLDWHIGFMTPYEECQGQAVQLSVTLKNDSKDFIPETTGSELVTNGGFASWSGGNLSGWTVTGESGSDPEVSQVAPYNTHGGGGSGAANLYSSDTDDIAISQTILTVGRTYHVTLNVTARAAGAIRCYCGTTPLYVPLRKPGRYEFVFNATATSFKIQNHTAASSCDVTVDNISVKQTNKYRMINKGMLVRLRGTLNGDTRQYFEGRILDIQHQLDPQRGNVMATLIVQCPTDELMRAQFQPKLLEDVTAKEILQYLFDRALIRYPYSSQHALLDVQGCYELDSVSLFDHDLITADTGITEHEFVGDTADRGQGVSAYGFIKDAIEAECGGRFFWSRAGQYEFHNRHRDLLNDTVTGTLSSADWMNPTYKQGNDQANKVTIRFFTRKVGAAGSVVWIMPGLPIQLRNGNQRAVTARYNDPDNENAKVGIKDEITPFPGTDFTFNTAEDGSGTDVSGRISVSVNWGATNAKIVFSNNSGLDAWLTYAQLRATPLITIEDEVSASDGDSIRDHELREYPMELRLLSDRNTAQGYAHFRVGRFKYPIPHLESITLYAQSNSTTQTAAHTYTVGTIIAVTDNYTGHDQDYVIVGEHHNYQHASGIHQVVYTLKPYSRELFAVLNQTGKNALDSGIRLGF